jgi:hypothetical protein
MLAHTAGPGASYAAAASRAAGARRFPAGGRGGTPGRGGAVGARAGWGPGSAAGVRELRSGSPGLRPR